MKNCKFLVAILVVASAAFAGCEEKTVTPPVALDTVTVEGDMTEIAGTITNYGEFIAKGNQGGCTVQILTSDKNDKDVVLCSAAVADDGSFTLDLPSTIKKELLNPLTLYMRDVEGMTIVGGENLFVDAELVIVGRNGRIHKISYGAESADWSVSGHLMFCSGRSTVTGGYQTQPPGDVFDFVYDIMLEPGWNWTYNVESDADSSYAFTHELPKGAALKFSL